MKKRLSESMEVLRDIQRLPSASVELGSFMLRTTSRDILNSPHLIDYTWWQNNTSSEFIATKDRESYIRRYGARRIVDKYPICGRSLKPIIVDEELLTIRTLINASGDDSSWIKRVELVGLENDTIHSAVGSSRVYGFVNEEIVGVSTMELPGAHPVTDEVARSLAIVLNEFAPHVQLGKIQLRPH